MSSGFKYWDIILTDVDGTSAIVQNNGTSDNRGVYKITASVAGTYYFYIDWNGSLSAFIETIRIIKSSGGGTLAVDLEAKIDGTWVQTYLNNIFSDEQTLIFNASQAATWNLINIKQAIYGVPLRLKCTCSASGDIMAQILRS